MPALCLIGKVNAHGLRVSLYPDVVARALSNFTSVHYRSVATSR